MLPVCLMNADAGQLFWCIFSTRTGIQPRSPPARGQASRGHASLENALSQGDRLANAASAFLGLAILKMLEIKQLAGPDARKKCPGAGLPGHFKEGVHRNPANS